MFDHLWIIYPCFCFCRLIIFICGFAAKITCTFFAYKRQWRNSPKKNTVRVRKTMLSSTFMIRLQGYSWKSGIAFIALQSLKITWTTPEMFPIWTPCCPQSKFWQDILILSWVRVFWEIFTPNWRMQDSRSSRSRFS